MNLGRRRTKHIDKEKKKFIYLTPCCLHAFSPLFSDSQCSSSDLVGYEQRCEMQTPIYHFFWSSTLVFLKTYTKHFSDQIMKRGVQKEKIWFPPQTLLQRSRWPAPRSSKSRSSPPRCLVMDLGLLCRLARWGPQLCRPPCRHLALSLALDIGLPWCNHKLMNRPSLCRIDCNLLIAK